MDRRSCDVVIIGSGIAGLRAAIEAARTSEGKADVVVVTKVQAMRSHSVSAEGGTAAVLYPELGDSVESHVFDTVKGSDYLGDQDAIERLVKMVPREIYQLEHWGMPWSRREDGRVAQRWFGGYSFPRATFAEDRVGFYEMQTLYDTCTRYPDIEFWQEWYATSLLVEGGEFRGVTGIEMKSGEFGVVAAKAGILATGGAGGMYGFSTYGHSTTPDGVVMACRAGVPLKDMEFVQFHPTGLVPSGILITEAARAEGGKLLNKDGEEFMRRYAPEKLELASRDVISRAMVTEVQEGRGLRHGASGREYLNLDLTRVGAAKVKERLAGIREISMKFGGIDPVEAPLPVYPACHYMMGGVDVDIDGATGVRGLWAAGEAACVSVHGANRLGANSTAECLVWGALTGREAAKRSEGRGALSPREEDVAREEKRIFDGVFRGRGGTDPYEVREECRRTMDTHAFVFRTGAGLEEGLRKVRELRATDFLHCDDKSRRYNTNLTNVLELDALLIASEATLTCALARAESRGAHARRDFPLRDDKGWLRHSLAWLTPEGFRLGSSPVRVTRYQPAERRY